ncbi:hypothetical protein [Rhodococcus baikonurensis]|uniref:Transposase n=1 Tax=Rhodococcus baikonurensis TaxID=172041 RepID=A0ABV5XKZ4_9NOCA
MNSTRSTYIRHHYPAEIIAHCVWLHYRFALSFEGKDEVHVDLEMAKRAQKSVQRMIEIGNPGGGE